MLNQVNVTYIDAYHSGLLSFLENVIPTFNTSVHGFDGLSLLDTYNPSHIEGELVYNPMPVMKEKEVRQ